MGGRPVALIEAAQALDGPWLPVPLRYQVNDPAAPLPLCWPHFPRMDWTLWFVPLGQTDAVDAMWTTRLLRGIVNGGPDPYPSPSPNPYPSPNPSPNPYPNPNPALT